jgi:hypothetical protein
MEIRRARQICQRAGRDVSHGIQARLHPQDLCRNWTACR